MSFFSISSPNLSFIPPPVSEKIDAEVTNRSLPFRRGSRVEGNKSRAEGKLSRVEGIWSRVEGN